MKRLLLFLLLTTASYSQTRVYGNEADKVFKGPTAPATCNIGDIFFDDDAVAGSNLFGCTSTDTWTLLGGGATLAFSGLTSATNTVAAMVVGTGASLAVSGSGTIASTTAAALSANQGTTVTVLHGNAAGTPAFAVVTPSDAAGNTSGSGNFALVGSPTFTGTLSAAAITATGAITGASLATSAATAGTFALAEPTATGTDAFTLSAPASVTANYTWTVPAAQAAAASVPEISAAGVITYDTFTGTGTEIVKSTSPTFITSALSPIFQSTNADTADAGIIRLGNAECIGWEASPTSTDLSLCVDSSESLTYNGNATISGSITHAGTLTAAANVTVRATGSNRVLTVQSTGSGGIVLDSTGGGHIENTQTTAPTVTAACGTSPTITGTNNAMAIVVGTGGTDATCTVTFADTWSYTPRCVANHEGAILLVRAVPTTTTVVISAATPLTASGRVTVLCL